MERTGRAFKADLLAEEYGFTDIDGRRQVSESAKAVAFQTASC